jgi:hypothetical protein
MKPRFYLPVLTLAALGPACLALAQNQVTSSAWTPAINTPNFLWYPTQKAIRFGQIDSSGSSYWTAANVGDYSFAGGLNAVAGAGSFAFGQNAYADAGFAFGENAFASGGFSFGSGAYGVYGAVVALGAGAEAHEESIAIGGYSVAFDGGVTLGYSTYAALLSVSAGMFSSATGVSSTALGYDATATADNTVALGSQSLASSYGGIALGYGNKAKTKSGGFSNASTAAAGDPVLMVGNAPQSWDGTDATRSNALTVYRDGDVHATGAIRVPQRGDILMGGYTAKPSGVAFP